MVNKRCSKWNNLRSDRTTLYQFTTKQGASYHVDHTLPNTRLARLYFVAGMQCGWMQWLNLTQLAQKAAVSC